MADFVNNSSAADAPSSVSQDNKQSACFSKVTANIIANISSPSVSENDKLKSQSSMFTVRKDRRPTMWTGVMVMVEYPPTDAKKEGDFNASSRFITYKLKKEGVDNNMPEWEKMHGNYESLGNDFDHANLKYWLITAYNGDILKPYDGKDLKDRYRSPKKDNDADRNISGELQSLMNNWKETSA